MSNAGFRSRLRNMLTVVLVTTACFARQAEARVPTDPTELVRRAVENEIKAAKDDTEHFLFHSTKTTPKGSVTKIYVETREATAGLVIAYNGKPLTPEQRRAEEARVERFISDPDELRKKRNQEREDSDRTMRIVRALPDAFLFDYVGEEQPPAGVGRPGHPVAKLNFRPNPRYQPPTRVEQVLTGMRGFVLLDVENARIALIDGTLFRDVSFGWGVLGRLDRGGHFHVEQQPVDDNSWQMTSMNLKFTGRILLLKSLVIDSNEVASGFRRVPPNLTFAQALDLLRKEETLLPNSAHESRSLDVRRPLGSLLFYAFPARSVSSRTVNF